MNNTTMASLFRAAAERCDKFREETDLMEDQCLAMDMVVLAGIIDIIADELQSPFLHAAARHLRNYVGDPT